MPDDEAESNFLSEKHQQGTQRLQSFLEKEYDKKPIRLNERQVKKYEKRGAVAGWAIQPPGLSRRIIVFVDSRYPFSVPKTGIDAAFPALTYPHIEDDGYLCIGELAVPKNEDKLEAVAQNIIAESVELIRKCFSGEIQDDFKDEILSYWDRAKSAEIPKCFSLLDLDEDHTARLVSIWKNIGDKNSTFIADTREDGERWLNQKRGKNKEWRSQEALFVWSDKLLMPSEYPENNRQVCDLLKNHCGANSLQLFQSLATKMPIEIDLVIGFKTDTGNALVNVVVNKPAQQDLIKGGFRPVRLPPVIAGQRYSSTKIKADRYNVQRIDPSWVLSRDSDKRIHDLKDKTVTIVGCGSIGSEVVRMLAQNGVGILNLVDPDTMDWENTGRHALGAEAIWLEGQEHKVKVLEHALKIQFPHIKIRSAHSKKWEDAIKDDKDAFHKADIIIMATGDWPAENAMNKYALAQANFPDVIYGWAEAYATAGHSFAVIKDGGCFNCAFDGTTFKFKLTTFENEQKRLPACGAVFQPYRSIELAPINAMIAGHAIDILTGVLEKSQIRSWVGSQNILTENNGKWTDIAVQKIKARGATSGQFLMQMDFDRIKGCDACSTKETKCDSQTDKTLA